MSTALGQPVSRPDGPAKVTGLALYTADVPAPGAAHAVMVPASIARGRILGFDLTDAVAAPGVIAVLTHENAPRLGRVTVPLAGEAVLPLQEPVVRYQGQVVALVVGDTLENATEAARLVRVDYAPEPFDADLDAALGRAEPVAEFFGIPLSRRIGDWAAAWDGAGARVEASYRTADRHHAAIEPGAVLASWHDGRLDVWDATQGVTDTRNCLAQALGLEPDGIRVRTGFIGGGFGGKGWGWPYQILAAVAARQVGGTVKLVLTRAQSFTAHGYQPATRQSVALAATADGRLTGIRHDTVMAGSHVGDHVEAAGWDTHPLYSWPAVSIDHDVVRLDRGNPAAMRSPFGGVGLVAVESAIDEMAHGLGMDPLELRQRNHADIDPGDGLPFSSKKLRECYAEGAHRFGWTARSHAPRSMRDGKELVGWGMATALLRAFRFPASARVSLDRDGRVLVETGTQDFGQGLSTVLPQIAADALGVPIGRVGLAIGDSTLPVAPFTGGSSVTMSVGSAVHDAALKLRARLVKGGANGPEGYSGALAALGVDRLSADGSWAPDEAAAKSALFSFGAVFAEVRVDVDIPVPRVSRVVGVYSAGRILSPKAARSQMTGGIVWGIGQALLESSETDPRLGRFLSKDLSGYLVPANADVPDIDASFVEEHDPDVGPLGARGIGELGALGIGPAISNAVFHATGMRVRDVPIRLEHLLGVG